MYGKDSIYDTWKLTSSDGKRVGPYDIDGNPVRRTKAEYPYSYDCYVIYQKNDKVDKRAHAVYSDRLWQQDSEKYDKSWKDAGGDGYRFDNAPTDVVEKFLRLFYGDNELSLEAIGEGANQSTGYPYWVFWFKQSR